MFVVYALYSPRCKKIYIGQTTDLNQRMLYHNELSEKGWTRSFRPWEVVYTEELPTRQAAKIREKQLKSARGREFVWEKVLEKYPETNCPELSGHQ